MSVMSNAVTFTLRDLNRQPARVLAAVRKFGSVEVCSRSGEVFTLAPKVQPKQKPGKAADIKSHFESLWQRQRDLGYVAPRPSDFDANRFNQIISGEE